MIQWGLSWRWFRNDEITYDMKVGSSFVLIGLGLRMCIEELSGAPLVNLDHRFPSWRRREVEGKNGQK